MASGFGFTGGPSRCFAYWQEFSKCYANTDNPQVCIAQSEDYLECLHHTKEIERAKTVKAQFIKKAEHEAKEGRKAGDILADGVIVGLGLISKEEDGGHK
ncbi:uncharacterized protein FOMMEDRAFT_130381 [Fomitiporia mediterranea MF3/22]|uniref:NADH dehydrogenase [ubiquinone] iron-sulfur protein 5 n=1 Tax=Fomitiporia mediterranea (strain MF3/22) TaxID=694068 RepID=R7SG49_FOMME|nr:uncharacterized protein FOMMEDRAFT_130381 [Fomitiporia mediterranea MF3/22]EJC97691.1 hypothetical protein FOMMEDRAFT_130381 [Fomitiporia mediterranea MF3/22]